MRMSRSVIGFTATALAWAVSMGILTAKEILPIVDRCPPTIFEELFTRFLPCEEWWYGLYHDDALCGGLRIYYDVIDEAGSAKALLRPSFWCPPLQVDGVVQVNARFRMETAHWDLRWDGTRSVLDARVTPDGIDWRGRVGDQAIHLRFPVARGKFGPDFGALLPLSISRDTKSGGVEQISFSLGSQEFHVSVWKDASGLIQRMDLPLAFSLRRGSGKIVMDFLKDKERKGAGAPLGALFKRGNNWMKLLSAVNP